MDEHYCNECVHYRWIEDLYDDGTYVNYEYCDGDVYNDCSYYQPACKNFCEDK